MNLFLIRHGQSVPNAEKRHSGWSMLPLTEKGVQDARRAGEALKNTEFDRVYSSDLTRAVQTARTALPAREPEQLPLIRERSVGSLAERLIEDCRAEYGETYAAARANMDFTPFGGENADQVRARATGFLRMLEQNPADNIAAFTHGGFILYCLECVLGVRLSAEKLIIENGAVIRLKYDGARWQYIV